MGPADLELGAQVGEGEAGVLEVEDGLAERLAVLGELDRLVEGALGGGLGRTAMERRSCGSWFIR